jgi:hypothetical protein
MCKQEYVFNEIRTIHKDSDQAGAFSHLQSFTPQTQNSVAHFCEIWQISSHAYFQSTVKPSTWL